MQYFEDKAKHAYELSQQRKFFTKSRAVVIKNGKLLLIRVDYNDGRKPHYLLPGGGIDEGETAKQAAVRETLEEYNVVVTAKTYLGKQYYKMPMEYKAEKFVSNRVDYYYLCEYIKEGDNKKFGVEEEFGRSDRTYTKIELSLAELKKINHEDLNNMSLQVYNRLIELMASYKK